MTKSVLTVREIMARAGEPKFIAETINDWVERGLAKRRCTVWAVWKWAKVGIDEAYWPVMIHLAEVTVQQLYDANRLIEKEAKNGTSHRDRKKFECVASG